MRVGALRAEGCVARVRVGVERVTTPELDRAVDRGAALEGVGARLGRVSLVGVGLAEVLRVVVTRTYSDLLGATILIRGVWVSGACTLVFLCAVGVPTLAVEIDRVAAVVWGVTVRATAVRCASRRGDSLYSGEAGPSGDAR